MDDGAETFRAASVRTADLTLEVDGTETVWAPSIARVWSDHVQRPGTPDDGDDVQHIVGAASSSTNFIGRQTVRSSQQSLAMPIKDQASEDGGVAGPLPPPLPTS